MNTSSGLARFSFPGYSAYGAMKAAVDSLSRYQALELGSRKIRVNSIAPGAIETDFGGGVVRDVAEMNQHLAADTALGRVGLDMGAVLPNIFGCCRVASRRPRRDFCLNLVLPFVILRCSIRFVTRHEPKDHRISPAKWQKR